MVVAAITDGHWSAPYHILTERRQEMSIRDRSKLLVVFFFACAVAVSTIPALGQLIDKTKAPNIADEGINKSLTQQIGAGRGDWMTPDSSSFIISRDPFRAIRRGRQLFQRKFTRAEGNGPVAGDGLGDMNNKLAIGAGLTDSCAACHGRPRGSAGVGGDVVTRPDSRDAPHLFGLGLKEMLADEITSDLRAIRSAADIQSTPLRPAGNQTTQEQGYQLRFDHSTARRNCGHISCSGCGCGPSHSTILPSWRNHLDS